MAIYTDETAAIPIYVGETITNAATTYAAPAVEAGTWFFRCDVHHDMIGTVTAGG